MQTILERVDFLRNIFCYDKLKFDYNELNTQTINSLINTYNITASDFINEFFNDEDSKRVKDIVLCKEEINHLTVGINFSSRLLDILRTVNLRIPGANNFTLKKYHTSSGSVNIHTELVKIANESVKKIQNYLNNIELIKADPCVYIPTLRGLRTFTFENNETNSIKSKNVYLDRTYNDYFKETGKARDQISTGIGIYDDVKKLLLSAKRGKVKEFEEFLSQSFFSGQDVNLVPHIDDDSLHIKIGKEEFPIYHLGDGIQAIIAITYPLFFNEKENLKVFIEEPELNLHPGLQRVLIETLLRPEFKTYQYFITTHSNHFLDITLDLEKISVYTFHKESTEKESKFIITNVENDDSEVLSLIGVKNSSVFLSNCTIWVEGITDRIYLRKYVEIIQQSENKKFKEDTHYSFVEYGGNNITHWSFLDSADPDHENINVERLCSKLMLITDNDGAGQDANGKAQKKKEKKYARFQQLKDKLGERYLLLPVREIENLLRKEIIQKVVFENEKNDGLDFSKFDSTKYKQQPLGKYINEKVGGIKKDYASDSGSIKEKVSFAKKAVAAIKSINDLSQEAKDLAKKVYDFIKEQNQ